MEPEHLPVKTFNPPDLDRHIEIWSSLGLHFVTLLAYAVGAAFAVWAVHALATRVIRPMLKPTIDGTQTMIKRLKK